MKRKQNDRSKAPSGDPSTGEGHSVGCPAPDGELVGWGSAGGPGPSLPPSCSKHVKALISTLVESVFPGRPHYAISQQAAGSGKG